ncbi:hypothetical protein RRF57_001764 [Xylaria bambusicola]|uniref:Uncharacterized protein n=1 Tax=Xylaria bambusicola TaxID=326684 RepID=A0AAN7Z3V9_9PEZI
MTADGMDAWGNITTICCIIRYHYKRATTSGPAKRWIERIVRAGLELLSDSDEDNDTYAFWLLGRLFVTIEDEESHKITWNMRNADQAKDLANWDEWVSTPIASPKSAPIRSMASMLHEKTSQVESNASISMRDRERAAPAKTNGRGDAKSQNGDVRKDEGKPLRTDTSSSAPAPAHGAEEFQPSEKAYENHDRPYRSCARRYTP